MAVKEETTLQENIQKYIESIGGYVNKNHGSMISEPGIADLTICYKGLYIAMEVKVNDNKPTKAQGIHCRRVLKAGGISIVVWSLEEVKRLFVYIDTILDNRIMPFNDIKYNIAKGINDNGSSY